MLGKTASVRRALGYHHGRDDGPRGPAQLACHCRREAYLRIETTEEVLHVDDQCLQFDHQQDAHIRVERQQVDPATLSVPAESHLRPDLPSRSGELPGSSLGKGRVIGISSPTKLG
ncbi:MAG: hypothetical protein ACRDE9_05270, partial [Candidatus Limnocylindria bacterium]